MSKDNELAIQEPESTAVAAPSQVNGFLPTRENVELLKKTLTGQGMSLTDGELQLTLYTAQRRGLDPLSKQIYPTKDRFGKLTFITSIDGYRLIAERTGKYLGQTEQEWCGEDGVWKKVWLESTPPRAARIGVYKRGFEHPQYAIARWDSYVQLGKEGKPRGQWAKGGDNQLSKCSEALALRKAFPEELGGLYTQEEMDQANNETAPAPTPKTNSKGVTPQAARQNIAQAVEILTQKGFDLAEDRQEVVLTIAGVDDVKKITGNVSVDILDKVTKLTADQLRTRYMSSIDGEDVGPMPANKDEVVEVTDEDLASVDQADPSKEETYVLPEFKKGNTNLIRPEMHRFAKKMYAIIGLENEKQIENFNQAAIGNNQPHSFDEMVKLLEVLVEEANARVENLKEEQ